MSLKFTVFLNTFRATHDIFGSEIIVFVFIWWLTSRLIKEHVLASLDSYSYMCFLNNEKFALTSNILTD